ncbi:DUF4041 domain-containing protein [Homoserinibacter sp. GY 40078]|uniref:DUF4041 domain-containing protein n=1 Tax=Homoserinibacter sp. GY 40078 TaxID=2603275 RepID=UPI0011CBED6C|nr:DUF4041 domain-containing protein [Homoserinibacter sp. GY 40078]TXK19078.1 DUF4041 domain-containing protein [Homoserinibacter sp. GY 40078]
MTPKPEESPKMNSGPQTPADWYADPTGRNERRYWNGSSWTDHVFSQGVQSIDPLVAATPAGTAVQPANYVGAVEPTAPRVPLFGARKAATAAHAENQRLQGLIDQYGLREVAELDALKQSILGQVELARVELSSVEASVAQARTDLDVVRAEVVDLRAAVGIQEFGVYDFEHPAESSVSLATELEKLRSEIKDAVRGGRATFATSNFTFNNSKSKGDKFVRDMSKLMLRSYNAEAENCVKAVRAGNLPAAQKRLSTAVDQVARLGTMIDLRITPYFHGLRLRELELAARHLQAVQAEKELERERREELRQQRLAEQELAREKERLEKERKHYANVLAALVEKGDIEGAERIRAQLEDVEKAISDVDYRAANIRAGYVYVISNVGSFGPEVVKIGMTRRLEPMDRVNELGDASVPFRFDVHAMFFADDAVAIESRLHQHFAARRLNRVNLRREYFRTTPAEVLEALKEHHVEVLEYTVEPSAPEYRASVAAEDDASSAD